MAFLFWFLIFLHIFILTPYNIREFLKEPDYDGKWVKYLVLSMMSSLFAMAGIIGFMTNHNFNYNQNFLGFASLYIFFSPIIILGICIYFSQK